jgi:hypothetical protein
MTRLSEALKTDGLSNMDMKKLVDILQSYGRKNDKILAHISPREAEILKRYGGSGGINPDTGLHEFAELDELSIAPPPPPQAYTPEPTATQQPSFSAPESVSQPQENSGFGGYNTGYFTGQEGFQSQGQAQAQQAPTVPMTAPLTVSGAAQPGITAPVDPAADTQKPSWWSKTQDSALKAIQDPSNLLKLGLGAGTLGLGLSQQAAARKQAAQTQAQYAALGAPFQQRGQEMINAAQQGVLTPQSQQTIQAAKAQLNQSVSNQGGVGAQQAAMQLGNLYNTLLNNQMTLGMSTVQIGDTFASQGIQAGVQANQQLQAMTQNYYATMMRMLVPTTATAPKAAS